MNKRSIILEKMWLFISIIVLFIAIYETYHKHISETYPLFIISGISAMMFALRKNIRQNKS
jgi:hypothetical protein